MARIPIAIRGVAHTASRVDHRRTPRRAADDPFGSTRDSRAPERLRRTRRGVPLSRREIPSRARRSGAMLGFNSRMRARAPEPLAKAAPLVEDQAVTPTVSPQKHPVTAFANTVFVDPVVKVRSGASPRRPAKLPESSSPPIRPPRGASAAANPIPNARLTRPTARVPVPRAQSVYRYVDKKTYLNWGLTSDWLVEGRAAPARRAPSTPPPSPNRPRPRRRALRRRGPERLQRGVRRDDRGFHRTSVQLPPRIHRVRIARRAAPGGHPAEEGGSRARARPSTNAPPDRTRVGISARVPPSSTSAAATVRLCCTRNCR